MNAVSLPLERRFDLGLAPLERPLVATDQLAADGVVRHIDRKGFHVSNIDERGVLPLEVARQETPLPESLVRGEIVGELDGKVEIGRRASLARDPGTERHRELYVRIATERSFEFGEHRERSSLPSIRGKRRIRHKTVAPSR